MALSSVNINDAKIKIVKCVVCKALLTLPASDAEQLVTWLADETISYPTIARACSDDEDTPSLSVSSLQRHASGGCGATEGLRSR